MKFNCSSVPILCQETKKKDFISREDNTEKDIIDYLKPIDAKLL